MLNEESDDSGMSASLSSVYCAGLQEDDKSGRKCIVRYSIALIPVEKGEGEYC